MAQFGVSSSEFPSLLQTGLNKLYDALKRAIEGYDFSPGWSVKGSGVFNHGLGVVPRFVAVQGSDDPSGAPYVQELAASVDGTSITVGGSKAYYRILANR